MSTKDVSHLSDIGKMPSSSDGSFNRKPSTFRNFIEKGGKFEPEKGELLFACRCSRAKVIAGRAIRRAPLSRRSSASAGSVLTYLSLILHHHHCYPEYQLISFHTGRYHLYVSYACRECLV